MKTKTINLYSLQELSKEAQERAHQDWIANNDYMFLGDCLNERLHEALEENGIKDLNDTSKPGTKPTPVLYSLSSCQGDGVCFEGDFEWKKYTINIRHVGRYYHSQSVAIELQETDNLGFDIGEDYEPKVYKEFQDIYEAICKSLESYGYDWIEEEDSFERFEQTCTENEYTFLEDGKMEN